MSSTSNRVAGFDVDYQVVCTLGGTVFVAILFLRVIWATVSYFQTSGNNFNQGRSSFGTAQPVT